MLTNRLGGWIGALILGAMSFAPGVHAEIWAYVDADGAVHLATERLDERYQLFYKGKTSADAAKAAAEASRTNVAALRSTAIYKRLVDHPNVERFKPLIDRNARAHGLDPALVKAVIAVESAFDPQAVSDKGALGLMQVMPGVGARYGVAGDRKRTLEQKLLDPEINVRVGTTYLRDLLALFVDDLVLALAAYNAGEQSVVRHGERVPPYRETQQYVQLVQQFYDLYRPPAPPEAARIRVPPRSAKVLPAER